MNGAREAYMKRRLKQARKKLDEAMVMSPNNPEALELLSHPARLG